MRPEKKFRPACVRPKRWFRREEYKKVQKQKVFGMTTSSGKVLAICLPMHFTAAKLAGLVASRVHPFLRQSVPEKQRFRLLFDGEGVLHAEPAKTVMDQRNIVPLENWPKYSPDLNPQEHVWKEAEERLRQKEHDSDTFEMFQRRCVDAVKKYSASSRLVGSMAKRMRLVIEKHGAMIEK